MATPNRRSAILRTGFVVGVLVVVFGVILPRFVDYEDVFAAFRDLTLPQVAVMTAFGALAWLASGLLFAALVHELSPLRGTASYLILGGVGSSVPLGPWNMGVLWVVVRGWGVPNRSATSGIALYGVINILGRLALPMLALIAVVATGGVGDPPGLPLLIALVSTVVVVVAGGVGLAVVRSDRAAELVARMAQRGVAILLRLLGRPAVRDVTRPIYKFRDGLGEVVRRRGVLAMLVSTLGQLAWCLALVVALRVTGVPETILDPVDVLVVFALVTAITIIPIAPGGAGIPELLYIAGLTAIAGDQHEATITAGVFLFRLYQWFLPIPIAWILLKLSRRGLSLLPTTAELRQYAMEAPA